jgi:outer membrane protein assembly factor BamB
MKISIPSLTAVLVFPLIANAEWPHWRGPSHDGVSREKAWNPRWEGEPKLLWRAQVGTGFSGITVAGGRVYTMGLDGKTETVYALAGATGKPVWKHGWPSVFKAQYYEGGTSGTPTVDGGSVYVLGQNGDLMSLDAATGKVAWQKNLATELGLEIGTWGLTGAPLVDGERLILNAGTSGTAVNKKTGAVVWKTGTDAAGYSTPVPLSLGGTPAAAVMGKDAVHVVDRSSGRVLWSHPWETKYDVNAADPIILPGGKMLVSSGYGHGAALLAFDAKGAREVWKNTKFRAQMNPGVAVGGHVYGFDGQADSRPALVCVDPATGNVLWKQEGLGMGSVIAAGETLIVLSEKGELITAPASPKGFTPVSRGQILTGKCWTVPTLAGGLLYARNWKGDVVCVDLRK